MENIQNQPPKKKRKILWIVIIVVAIVIFLFIILFAVSRTLTNLPAQYPSDDYSFDAAEESVMSAPGYGGSERMAMMDEAEQPVAKSDGSTAIPEGTERKVIQEADLDLLVNSVSEAVEKVTSAAEESDGFVSSSGIRKRDDGTSYGSMTARVPADKFSSTLQTIKDIATVVNVEKVSGLDVTEEFVDLEARIGNLRSEESQYQEIMKQAVKIEDILKVTKELNRVRGSIELLEGRKKFLTDQTDMSTITVSLDEEVSTLPSKDVWRPLAVLKTAFSSMVRTLQVLVNILIWLVIFGIPIGIIVWIVVKIVKRFIKKKAPGQV